jgi:hypothetical protein
MLLLCTHTLIAQRAALPSSGTSAGQTSLAEATNPGYGGRLPSPEWAAYLPSTDTFQFELLEFGPVWRQVQDQSTAQSIFRGPGLMFGNGNIRWTSKNIQQYRSWFGYHNIQPPEGPVTHELYMDFQYGYARCIRQTRNSYFALGGHIGFLGPIRATPGLGNSFLSWEIVGGIGPWFYAHRRFPSPFGESDWQAYIELQFPVATYVNRPRYGLVLSRDQEQDRFFAHPGDVLRLQAEIGLSFWRLHVPRRPKPLDRWKLAYRWELLDSGKGQPLTSGIHMLQAGFMIGQDRVADEKRRAQKRAERQAKRQTRRDSNR